MQVDVDLRERLSYYCLVTKKRQEQAANIAIREMLDRCDSDPEFKERMDRARTLKAAMDALCQPIKKAATSGV
jgi:transposase-like protein